MFIRTIDTGLYKYKKIEQKNLNINRYNTSGIRGTNKKTRNKIIFKKYMNEHSFPSMPKRWRWWGGVEIQTC